MECPNCHGNGEVQISNPHYGEYDGISPEPMFVMDACHLCNGTGEIESKDDDGSYEPIPEGDD